MRKEYQNGILSMELKQNNLENNHISRSCEKIEIKSEFEVPLGSSLFIDAEPFY